MSSAALNLHHNTQTSSLMAPQALSLEPLTNKKPDLNSAMLNLIEEVKTNSHFTSRRRLSVGQKETARVALRNY